MHLSVSWRPSEDRANLMHNLPCVHPSLTFLSLLYSRMEFLLANAFFNISVVLHDRRSVCDPVMSHGPFSFRREARSFVDSLHLPK